MTKQKQRSVGSLFAELDVFAKPVEFKFNHGQTKYKTKLGALFAVFTVMSVAAFAAKRWTEMAHFADAQIKTTNYDNFYDENFQYDGENQFAFAIAMTDPSLSRFDYGDDPDYGEFRFYYSGWDQEEQTPEITLPSRACQLDSDFGMFEEESTDEKSKFYDTSQPTFLELPGFRCIDDPVVLYGNEHTDYSQSLMISYEACDVKKRKTCKTAEKEIQAFFAKKSLVLIYNKSTFAKDGSHEKTINREVGFDVVPLDPGKKWLQKYNVKVTEILTNDKYFIGSQNNQTFANIEKDKDPKSLSNDFTF